MPLLSPLFRDDARLQACLVSHGAHVVPGARGVHVARIQSALVRLRVLDAADARREAGRYGAKTTAAVLAYKNALGIVNREYQKSADNIVGRMTIASLDTAICLLEGMPGPRRMVAFPAPHPASPSTPPASAGAPDAPAAVVRAQAAFVRAPAGLVGAPAGAFAPPLSALPIDVQDAVRRSNDAKVPGTLQLFPFVAKHEGPLSGAELSARFAEHADAATILVDLHARMRAFDLWKNVRIIVNVYRGTGSRGLFCEPFDHDRFLAQMTALTDGPRRRGPDPNVVPLQFPLRDARFCRDAINVHGPRDSFREIVASGPGLHICITQPAQRAMEACDLHIDQIQQGQVCWEGFCVPIVNGQTIEHLETVGPWLAEEAKKWWRK